ncbi:MAG: D-alanyl-D-alanine carboxypeptidase [Oscillospiraceae bacterium]|nr:D-alanyl-D-alanine carboxypeptidase [Oscillospiraceae bacterium]
MKKLFSILLTLLMLALIVTPALAAPADYPSVDPKDADAIDVAAVIAAEAAAADGQITVKAPSAILMERRTGAVIYEKDADAPREPASVTKIMTLLLAIEAIESGALKLDDVITTSDRAASMGGSQIYLKAGEQMTVRDIMRAIAVNSANDAAVAMAEQLAGSEETFAAKMNARAAELGMTNTHFTNCSGLPDDGTHVTTARDIALMSRELMSHKSIREFTTIWTGTLRGGTFNLANTNKLIRYYNGATGLKTGFTNKAGYCLSATAERDGVEYIAVVLGAATSPDRFEAASSLLSYGFANYTVVSAAPDEVIAPLKVDLGRVRVVQPVVRGAEWLLVARADAKTLTKTVELLPGVLAPVSEGDKLGTLTLTAGDTVLGTYDVVAAESVERLSWSDIFLAFWKLLFTIKTK